VSDRLTKSPLTHRWEIPQVMLTREGHNHWQSPDGSFWRAIHYLDKAKTHDILQNANQAEEMGYALGLFHTLISDLPPEQLIDTLEGFHITPSYLAQYQQVLATNPIPSSPDVDYCLRFVSDRADWASVLENAKVEGKLPLRPIHGDPKVNNVLFDQETHRAIALIDLDTLKPGLIHYDIGDCLRSSCNRLGEETQDWPAVDFDLTLCQGLLKGYLSVAQGFLTPADRDFFFDAMRLLAFELGLRFFGDYLAGNPYFKVNHPDHNLQRALVQFQLTASIEEKEPKIRALIAKF
jgi:Ser/Thr protein kinase RdoA (MazF antagonist)